MFHKLFQIISQSCNSFLKIFHYHIIVLGVHCDIYKRAYREGVGVGGEMTQALYAHMNNKK
jgi:hypothetical protein